MSLTQPPNHLLELASETQKNHMEEAIKLIDEFDKITSDIQSILQSAVKAHERHFLFRFKQQMCTVKDKLKALEKQLDEKNKKISYYESQATVGQLKIQIAEFEKQEAKLFAALNKKNMQIKDLKIQIKIGKSENKRLQDKFRQLIRYKIKNVQNQESSQNNLPYPTFSTEILPIKISSLQRKAKQDKSVKKNSFSKKQKSFSSCGAINIDTINFNLGKKFQSQNKKQKFFGYEELQIKNKKIIEQQPIRQFLIKIIDEMKQKICIKKKLKKCSFKDFKSQDKQELLLAIISNEQLLSSLYKLIFNFKQIDEQSEKKNMISTYRKMSAARSITHRNAFPSLNSTNTCINKLEQI